MDDREVGCWDQLVEATYGAVRLEGGRLLIERTDVEKDPVTGGLERVTERVPLGWVLAYLPREQELVRGHRGQVPSPGGQRRPAM